MSFVAFSFIRNHWQLVTTHYAGWHWFNAESAAGGNQNGQGGIETTMAGACICTHAKRAIINYPHVCMCVGAAESIGRDACGLIYFGERHRRS
jgi:hypothetical protein